MDIYIAIVVSGIFLLLLWRELSAAARRQKLTEFAKAVVSQGLKITEDFLKAQEAKGEDNEKGTDTGKETTERDEQGS